MDDARAFLAELDDLIARGLVDVEDEHDDPRFRTNPAMLVAAGLDEPQDLFVYRQSER